MMIYKCDMCKKTLKSGQNNPAAGQGYARWTFCEKCGKPITDFLNKHHLLEKEDRRWADVPGGGKRQKK